MTLIGTLWDHADQRMSKVILSVAALNGFELRKPPWSLQERPAEFTTKFPFNKVPAFEGTDGFKLTEGAAIARYLCTIGSVNLLGSNAKETALVDQWVHFVEHEMRTPVFNQMGLVHGFVKPFSREALDDLSGRLARALSYLESHLATRSSGYLVLDTLSLADLVLVSVVSLASRIALGIAERTEYPHIFAHYAKVTEEAKQDWGTKAFVDVRTTEPTSFSLVETLTESHTDE